MYINPERMRDLIKNSEYVTKNNLYLKRVISLEKILPNTNAFIKLSQSS